MDIHELCNTSLLEVSVHMIDLVISLLVTLMTTALA